MTKRKDIQREIDSIKRELQTEDDLLRHLDDFDLGSDQLGQIKAAATPVFKAFEVFKAEVIRVLTDELNKCPAEAGDE